MSNGPVFESAFGNALVKSLKKIIDDNLSDGKKNLAAFKFMDEDTMDGAYADYLEMSGPAYIKKKPEGAPMSYGTIKEGAFTRFMSETFALAIGVTEEAVEDERYSECINAAERLTNAGWQTVDQCAALILCRAFTSGYNGGDGVPLCSASHPIPQGGTASNVAASPASPSRVAVNAAITALKRMKGHDGAYHPITATKIVCPTEQWATWQQLVLTPKAPEPGQFNEVNLVNRLFNGVDSIVEVPYWNTTSTQWGLKTDVKDGLMFVWRKRFSKRDWKDNANTIMSFAVRARFVPGWVDWRGFYGVQA